MTTTQPEASSEVRMVPIGKIIPNPDNPRVNSGAVAYVVESIRQFGFRVPVVLGSDNMIVAGHTRYRAAVQLGMTEVPCIDVSHLTPEEQTAFAIAENRTSDFAFFDLPRLTEQMAELPSDLLAGFEMDSLITSDVSPDDGEESAGGASPSKRAGLDLAPFEKYQYVTIICRTEFDYVNLLDRLKLEDVQKRYVNGALKRGTSYGRVIEYSDFVERENDWRREAWDLMGGQS